MTNKLLLTLSILLVLSMVTIGNGIVYSQTLPQATGNRVAFTGDVDCNADQQKDFKTMKEIGVTTVVVAGDYAYKNGQCVLDYLKTNGYTSANTILADGNHDKCKDIKKFTLEKQCYYTKTIGNVQYFVLDLEAGLTAKDVQFNDVAKWLQGSTAQYKVVVIHEPFVTAKSTHKANGKFGSMQELFVENNVSIVDQAHNHNYQRFLVNGITYLVTGNGYHDKGLKLYDLKGTSDPNGGKLLKGVDDKNGFTVVDFGNDGYSGYSLTSDKLVLDQFGKNVTTTPPVENGTIDTNPNEVCVCRNDTVPIPPVNQTQPIAENITVSMINNASDIGNYTKILTDRQQIAIVPLLNNTDIKILGNLREPE